LPLELSDEERQVLTGWSRRTTVQSLALRSRIVLECGAGRPNSAVAESLGVSRETVRKWRSRFARDRLAGLSDVPRPGRPRTISDERVNLVVTKTLEERGPGERTHWSTRSMAAAAGMSQTTVSRIWRAFGLKPHLTEAWKLSTDPQFIDKVRGVAGLYLDPPEHALVLCTEEKNQIQAIERTAPCLPLLPATPAPMGHDYVRNGTASLFAALRVASGSVVARRRRHREFLRFLKLIEEAVPPGLDLHLVCDNHSPHQTEAVKTWLLRHPRFHLHFTPAGWSGLNLVERWFAELANRKLRRCAHPNVTELEACIRRWISERNASPRPFVWTITADQLVESLAPIPTQGTSQAIRS
jgi:transposase